ncbi:class I SAM-dependent methyltransferase [Streptomyces sp. Midd1]|uniref:class I SAM-dependent methyltransferase n=1 Tax=Streptomyces sp. Midd3 TaxID=3161191 RepID=UPI0034DABD09
MNKIDENWSKAYDGGKDFRPLFPIDLDRILALLPDDEEKQHLDIGCGTGGLTREMFHRGYTSTGIDPSSSAIERAKSATIYLGRGLTYMHDDFESVALEKEAYSLVTCKLVYAFFEDKRACLEKMRSLLSASGRVALITKVHDSADTATPISVDESEIRDALRETFGNVQELDLEWAKCFVCHR